LRKPEGLKPGGIVNNGEEATTKLVGLLCLNPEVLSFKELSLWVKKVGVARGEAMAPARS